MFASPLEPLCWKCWKTCEINQQACGSQSARRQFHNEMCVLSFETTCFSLDTLKHPPSARQIEGANNKRLVWPFVGPKLWHSHWIRLIEFSALDCEMNCENESLESDQLKRLEIVEHIVPRTSLLMLSIICWVRSWWQWPCECLLLLVTCLSWLFY